MSRKSWVPLCLCICLAVLIQRSSQQAVDQPAAGQGALNQQRSGQRAANQQRAGQQAANQQRAGQQAANQQREGQQAANQQKVDEQAVNQQASNKSTAGTRRQRPSGDGFSGMMNMIFSEVMKSVGRGMGGGPPPGFGRSANGTRSAPGGGMLGMMRGIMGGMMGGPRPRPAENSTGDTGDSKNQTAPGGDPIQGIFTQLENVFGSTGRNKPPANNTVTRVAPRNQGGPNEGLTRGQQTGLPADPYSRRQRFVGPLAQPMGIPYAQRVMPIPYYATGQQMVGTGQFLVPMNAQRHRTWMTHYPSQMSQGRIPMNFLPPPRQFMNFKPAQSGPNHNRTSPRANGSNPLGTRSGMFGEDTGGIHGLAVDRPMNGATRGMGMSDIPLGMGEIHSRMGGVPREGFGGVHMQLGGFPVGMGRAAPSLVGPFRGMGAPRQEMGGRPREMGAPPQGMDGASQRINGPPLEMGGPPRGMGGPPEAVGGSPQGMGGPPGVGGAPQGMGGPPGVGGAPQGMGGPPPGVGGSPQGMGGIMRMILQGGNGTLGQPPPGILNRIMPMMSGMIQNVVARIRSRSGSPTSRPPTSPPVIKPKPVFCQEYDCPPFTVIRKGENYELRRYSSMVFAATDMALRKTYPKVRAYWALAAYMLQGENDEGLRMTLTVPILTRTKNNTRTMYSLLPYLRQTNPPVPTVRRVKIVKLPAMEVYVRPAPGYLSDSQFKAHIEALKSELGLNDTYLPNETITAGYDTMFKFRKRYNEVWLVSKYLGEEEVLIPYKQSSRPLAGQTRGQASNQTPPSLQNPSQFISAQQTINQIRPAENAEYQRTANEQTGNRIQTVQGITSGARQDGWSNRVVENTVKSTRSQTARPGKPSPHTTKRLTTISRTSVESTTKQPLPPVSPANPVSRIESVANQKAPTLQRVRTLPLLVRVTTQPTTDSPVTDPAPPEVKPTPAGDRPIDTAVDGPKPPNIWFVDNHPSSISKKRHPQQDKPMYPRRPGFVIRPGRNIF